MTCFPVNPDATGNRAHLCRAAFAAFAARAVSPNVSPEDEAARRWPRDETPGAVLRAATSPGGTADHAGLVQSAVADFLGHLGQSAASRLMAECLSLPLGRNSTLTVPYDASTAPSAPPWVAENAPIAVHGGPTGAVVLGPLHKLAAICVASRELAKRPAGERIFGHMLRERAAQAFDLALFATTAADTDRPAGLLYDLAPLDAGPLGSSAEALAALAGALGDAGGSGRVVIVAHPSTAALIGLGHPQLAWPVLASRALTIGHIVAIDPVGLVFGTGAEIDIEATTAGAIHMSDTAAEIVAGGGATADPVTELFQVDAVALRLLLDLTFAARPGAVQHVQGVSTP